MSKKDLHIIKRSQELVPFSYDKLARSIEITGLTKERQQLIIERIKPILYDGISSKEIYDYVFQLLKGEAHHSAARYKLKKALFELGPTGYPFEKYIGALLHKIGYTTEVSVILQGKCVAHEVDVLATKEEQTFVVECKFHSSMDRSSSIKDALYIKARFDDIRQHWNREHKKPLDNGWLITNTRFTEDAITFASCEVLKILSWDYPDTQGLKSIITLFRMYPLTCSTTLTHNEKQALIDQGAVLCQDLLDRPFRLDKIKLSPSRKDLVLKELAAICDIK